MATQLQQPQPESVSHNGSGPEHAGQTVTGVQAGELRPKLEVKAESEAQATAPGKKPAKLVAFLKRNRRAALLVAVIVLLSGSASAWFYFTSYESTDDAQVDGHLHPVSARISGTILSVNPEVEDNHFVQAGTVVGENQPPALQGERG